MNVKKTIKEYLMNMMIGAFIRSYKDVNQTVVKYIAQKNIKGKIKILDLGYADGKTTVKYLDKIKNYDLYAVDCEDNVDKKNISYFKLNLESDVFPFKNDFFDIVLVGQTIEHILNKDWLIEESHRVLKRGGLFICTTENIASIDNIISLIFGQEPLSQHTGAKYHTHSFFSPHFMEKIDSKLGNKYLHKNVCSYYGLTRLIKINGFLNYRIVSLGNINILFEKLFKIYNRILIVYAIK